MHKQNLKRIDMNLPAADVERMRNVCILSGFTMTHFIREAIREKLEKEQAAEPEVRRPNTNG